MSENWKLPGKDIFSSSADSGVENIQDDMENIGHVLVEKLDSLKHRCELERTIVGPRTVLFELEAAEGVEIRRLPALAPELQYEVGAKSMRVLAPVPGKRAVALEIENPNPILVQLGDFPASPNLPLTVPLGIAPDSSRRYLEIAEQPHLLVAGVTGGGKSAFLHSIISSLIAEYTPDQLNLLLVDTKTVELTQYEGIPHLITNVITNALQTSAAFAGIVEVMNGRYNLAASIGARTLPEMNEKLDDPLPYIIVAVDEIADLMMIAKAHIEDSIVRIAQKARAVGIHLILATQTPRREIITGILKANLPSRCGFATSSALDSRIILDTNGTESLLGNGDFLFSAQGRPAERMQSPLVTKDEIETLTRYWKEQ